MTDTKYDIFISYRRDTGDVLAKLLYETLRQKNYSVFFDHESLHSGVFGETILSTINDAKDVLVVLSKDCFVRCNEQDDWMLQEIREAIKHNKNIILVFSKDFVIPSSQELKSYPEEIEKLLKFQGQKISIEHYDYTLGKIIEGFNSVPAPYTENDERNAADFLLKNGTQKLSENEKNSLINSLLTSYHGEKIAEIMSSFLQTNPRYYNNIRKKFIYEISVKNTFSFGNINIDSNKYFTLEENISYEKHLLNSTIENEFWISFVRDLNDVDESLRDENYIFSENLLIQDSDMDIIINLSEEEQKSFFTKQMRVRFNLNKKVLTPSTLIINKTGIFAKYEITDIGIDTNSTVLDVRIAFSIPHRKVESYFFASISDPTYSPQISFSYSNDDVDVEMISFMNRNITTTKANIFEGLREVSLENEWIIPMSGVVFIMTPKFCE